MGPPDIKAYIYSVMSDSRELTNYCQESVRPNHSKKLSDSLNSYHCKDAISFITESLVSEEYVFSESNEINFDDTISSDDKPIYNKVMDYIENYLLHFRV